MILWEDDLPGPLASKLLNLLTNQENLLDVD